MIDFNSLFARIPFPRREILDACICKILNGESKHSLVIKMTLGIAVQGKDFLIIGIDSRGIFGDIRRVATTIDLMKKYSFLTSHVGVLTAGIGELGNSLIMDYQNAHAQKKRKIDGVSKILADFRKFLMKRWNEYFAKIPFEHQPPVQLCLAGLDETSKGFDLPRIYSINSRMGFAPCIHQYGFGIIGKGLLANYIINRRYKKDLTMEEAAKLVVYAIDETASQDTTVGGKINLASITKPGYKIFKDDEITKLR